MPGGYQQGVIVHPDGQGGLGAGGGAPAHDAQVDGVQRQLGQDPGQDGGDPAPGVEQAGDQSRQHPGQNGAQGGDPDVDAVEGQQYAGGPPGGQGAVRRQVGHVQNAVGDIDADGHDAPDQALAHGARHGFQQGGQEFHRRVLLYRKIAQGRKRDLLFSALCSTNAQPMAS